MHPPAGKHRPATRVGGLRLGGRFWGVRPCEVVGMERNAKNRLCQPLFQVAVAGGHFKIGDFGGFLNMSKK